MKVVFYFEWFDSCYCYVTSNKSFRILAENFKQGCQYCVLRVEMNKLRKDIFFWKTLSVSISFRILRKTILDIQQKKARPPQLHLTCPEAKMYEKRFFLEYSQFYSFVRTVTETHSKFRLKILLLVLQTACTCPNERFERNDFLSNLSKSPFRQTLSGKYPAPL